MVAQASLYEAQIITTGRSIAPCRRRRQAWSDVCWEVDRLVSDCKRVAPPRLAEQGGSFKYLVAGMIYRDMERSRFAGHGRSPALVCYSAVECTGGWAAVQCGVNRGFSSWVNISIALKELTPIVLVALVFGWDFQNHHVGQLHGCRGTVARYVRGSACAATASHASPCGCTL